MQRAREEEMMKRAHAKKQAEELAARKHKAEVLAKIKGA